MKQTEQSELARKLLKDTVARFPHANLPQETLRAYRQDWERMIREFGAKLFEAKLRGAIAAAVFFPNEAAIREAEAKYDADGRAGRCVLCRETEGWLYEQAANQTQPRVRKCAHLGANG